LSLFQLQQVADHFCNRVQVVLVGTEHDRTLQNCVSLLNRKNLDELAWILKNSLVCLVPDSLCLHLCEATGAKAVCLFGCTLPHCVIAKDYEELIVVENSEVACRGCRHRWYGTNLQCYYGTNICMTSLRVEDIIHSMEFLMAPSAVPSFLQNAQMSTGSG
jgi:ADP-heptose:LPS heptosyltransferase